MIDKVKTFLTITLVVIFIFAVGYSLIKVMIKSFEEPTLITLENVAEYAKEENIVASYTIYYFYESCMNNLIEACKSQMYSELINIYISDYLKASGEEKITEKLQKVNEMATPKDMDEKIEYSLKAVYSTDVGYLAEININEEVIYVIFSEANSKELDYSFALI